MAVYFISVGQGDSEYLVFPNGQTLLIDTGTGRTASNSKIAEVVKHIDTLVITHDHADHTGGLEYIESHYHTPEILSYTQLNRGEYLHVDDANVTLKILNPTGFLSDEENDRSVVIKAVYGCVSFLFTGDASSKIESRFDDGHIDVLKVGHHGSSTSTSGNFIRNTAPDVAIISVGDNNYGHPAKDLLARLKGKTDIYRTDIDGTIRICTDGNLYRVDKRV